MPPEKRYSAAEVMGMNRADRRRLGAINGVKIPSIRNLAPAIKKEIKAEDKKVIDKLINEKRNIQK